MANERAAKKLDVRQPSAGKLDAQQPSTGKPDAKQRSLERLLKAHESWFNVEREHAFGGRVFPGYAEFHAEDSQYVLVKRAKLWEASSHEYLFFVVLDTLDAPAFADLLAFMKTTALDKIELDENHMTSYLSLVVIADEADDGVLAQVKKTRFRKNFAWGLKGWADLRIAIIVLDDKCVVTNSMGKPLAHTIEQNMVV